MATQTNKKREAGALPADEVRLDPTVGAAPEVAAALVFTAVISLVRRGITIIDRLALSVSLIFNTMIKKGEQAIFPATLSPEAAFKIVDTYCETLALRDSAHVDEIAAVAKANAAHKDGKRNYRRLKLLVDGSYEHGDPRRAVFFAKPGRGGSLQTRFEAMLKGIAMYPLPLPPDLQVETIRTSTQEVGIAETARTDAGDQRDTQSTDLDNQKNEVRRVKRLLGRTLRGYLGEHNPLLSEYGLKVRIKSTGAPKKKIAKKTATTPPTATKTQSATKTANETSAASEARSAPAPAQGNAPAATENVPPAQAIEVVNAMSGEGGNPEQSHPPAIPPPAPPQAHKTLIEID